MNLVVDRLRGERGFTLVEILIVLLLLGVLAGIGILAFQPFTDVADEACREAGEAISGVRVAAEEAGVDAGHLDAPELPDCA